MKYLPVHPVNNTTCHSETAKRPKNLLLILLLLSFCLAAPRGWADDTRLGNEPIQNIIQASIDNNPGIFAKNKAEAAYLKTFLPIWKQMLNQLFSQDATEGHLETFFADNANLIRKTSPAFDKMKPPSDFKDFQDVFIRGLGELSDWCADMRDRIHYAKTPYQKDAYMKKIEGFRSAWYDTFFGDALDEMNNAMTIFLAAHWMEGLDPNQALSLKKNPETAQYLNQYHKINLLHLKATEATTKKVREDREKNKGNDDPRDYAQSLTKELGELKKTVTSLKKINPPAAFKDFHSLELSFLDTRIRGTELILQIQDANAKKTPDEKIQALVSQKNEVEEEAGTLKAATDKAYADALKSL